VSGAALQRRFRKDERGFLLMADGSSVPVSRLYRAAVRAANLI